MHVETCLVVREGVAKCREGYVWPVVWQVVMLPVVMSPVVTAMSARASWWMVMVVCRREAMSARTSWWMVVFVGAQQPGSILHEDAFVAAAPLHHRRPRRSQQCIGLAWRVRRSLPVVSTLARREHRARPIATASMIPVSY